MLHVLNLGMRRWRRRGTRSSEGRHKDRARRNCAVQGLKDLKSTKCKKCRHRKSEIDKERHKN